MGNFSIARRWLPLENNYVNLLKTPIVNAQYRAFGPGWWSWPMAAQQHYSLFEHLEKNTMSRYWAGGEDGIWNVHYERQSINLIAIWGSSVAAKLPAADDETELTVTIPKLLNKRKPLPLDRTSKRWLKSMGSCLNRHSCYRCSLRLQDSGGARDHGPAC